jgi:hypothetical protein
LAYSVIFEVTVVEEVNCDPPPLRDVYHPSKAYPLMIGFEGIEDPTEPPPFTVRVCVVGVPPSALNVIVYCVDALAVHLAYTVIFEVTVVEEVNCDPPPLRDVYQPPKALPLLVGFEGIDDPTEPLPFTVRVCVAGVPPSALNVTV